MAQVTLNKLESSVSIALTPSELFSLSHRYDDPEETLSQIVNQFFTDLVKSVEIDAVQFAKTKKLAIDFAVEDDEIDKMKGDDEYESKEDEHKRKKEEKREEEKREEKRKKEEKRELEENGNG